MIRRTEFAAFFVSAGLMPAAAGPTPENGCKSNITHDAAEAILGEPIGHWRKAEAAAYAKILSTGTPLEIELFKNAAAVELKEMRRCIDAQFGITPEQRAKIDAGANHRL